jgi:peroxiredoxin
MTRRLSFKWLPLLVAAACIALPAHAEAQSQYRYRWEWMPPEEQAEKDTVQINAALEAAKKTPIQYTATTMDGKTIDFAKLRGKVVIIEFWSLSDCYQCVEAQSYLKDVYKKYHAKGFEIIRIAVEKSDETKSLVQETSRVNEIGWPVVFAPEGRRANALAKKYGVYQLPQLFLFDKKGLLIDDYLMAYDAESYVKSLIAMK